MIEWIEENAQWPRSGRRCVPTQSVGTRATGNEGALCYNAPMPALRPLPLIVALFALSAARARADELSLDRDLLPLFKVRCVKCHGPAKQEGKLNLASSRGLARGGQTGSAIDREMPLESLLWQRVADDEMPPDEPLSDDERATIRRWLETGATDLPPLVDGSESSDHWAFGRLTRPRPPLVRDATRIRNPVDQFIVAALEERGLSLSPEADRHTIIRRLTFDLTGLPLSPDEIARFVDDPGPGAYEQLVERLLASPHYGERWGRHWLDAAGYADSNGYFSADSDRPLAYRYRDYVVGALNRDKPFDRFIQEQLAGDELAGYRPGADVIPAKAELLVATHFLRNGQDGTGESDGNPDEVRADRYSVLEGAVQIMGSALFGLTFQCARCHDHKFEPVAQREYYQLQAILSPAFDLQQWIKPNDRQLCTASAAEIAAWEARMRHLDAEVGRLRGEFAAWVRERRPRGDVLFEDQFDSPDQLTAHWSNTAPGDDGPGGSPAVNVASSSRPGAEAIDGRLRIAEAGGAGNRWLSSLRSFDWTPDEPGNWIQATFDLADDKLQAGEAPAARIGYYIAMTDFHDNGGTGGGNILIDGNPAGGAQLHVDYPGDDARSVGQVGTSGYSPGHSFGVRISNAGEGKFLVEQLVDQIAEEKTVTLTAADLPDGGFGFEYCCGRSFIVDNVIVERGRPSAPGAEHGAPNFADEFQVRRKQLEESVAGLNALRTDKPGKTAIVTDLSPSPPDVFLLVRGNYGQPGEKVEPGVPAALADADNAYVVAPPSSSSATTGRRLALAQWLTRPGSRAAALLARVTVNRVWQQHFETALAATPDNLGYSGAPPSHPELLDWLAAEFTESNWSLKALHRQIVTSAAYRQSSQPRDDALGRDPGNRLLWRYPLRRLDAESVRDGMLAAGGELDLTVGGPYVPTQRNAQGEVFVDETRSGANRRSLYVQQRRTQVLSLLEVFDAPSIVTNCTRRSSATIPLQSLTALNSEFALARARALAARLAQEPPDDADSRIERAILLVAGRPPVEAEREASRRFLAAQAANYPDRADAAEQVWIDFCQMLMAGSAFLYVE